MPTINIGQFTRPGIYQPEYDQSVIATPTFQGINTMVIGVSKTGPVNTPILISNITDLTNNFGPLDRTLERNGSFFHRTIANMIQSSPLYAINLLITNDTLDVIQYQSLSAASNLTNDVVRTGPYRRCF
jgi:hypothetical protein